MCDELLPIGCDMLNAKLFGDRLSAFAIATGNSDDLRSHAIAKAGDLRRAGKPRPDNADSNR